MSRFIFSLTAPLPFQRFAVAWYLRKSKIFVYQKWNHFASLSQFSNTYIHVSRDNGQPGGQSSEIILYFSLSIPSAQKEWLNTRGPLYTTRVGTRTRYHLVSTTIPTQTTCKNPKLISPLLFSESTFNILETYCCFYNWCLKSSWTHVIYCDGIIMLNTWGF